MKRWLRKRKAHPKLMNQEANSQGSEPFSQKLPDFTAQGQMCKSQGA